MPIPTVDYGFWPSDWSAAQAAAASADFAELHVAHGGLYWIRYSPSDSRCTLWFWNGRHADCLTPPGFSLRSRVYEYGGGAFCALDQGWVFVNEADQQLYRQDSAGAAPRALTASSTRRYGDLCFDPQAAAVLAVEECHDTDVVRHRLVSIALADGVRRVIAEGADFYAAPRLSADATQLAWIEWQRPHQPWTETSLWRARRGADGAWTTAETLAGQGGGEALQQPRFDPVGSLHVLTDRQGWWQPWLLQGADLLPLAEHERVRVAAADHAPAPWQLGICSYLPLGERRWLLSRFEDGFGLLCELTVDGERRLAADYTRFRQLAADARCFYAIAAAPDRLPAVIAIDRRSGAVQVLVGGERPLPSNLLSRPEPLRFASGDGEQAQAFFYPPRSANCRAPGRAKPPLVVFLHGGPTSACYPVFDPRIQFWTQRGFAVADLNYRGSSGFGRAMRMRLKGEWGRIDVEDACALLAHLAAARRIDAGQAFIRGASAGGYTALCALAFRQVFRGGASLYGVSDPLSLRRATHKFEGDYLDWLIGDPERDASRYRERTPLLHARSIHSPVIFFQGGRDRVVVPQQTESMVAALRERDLSVEYHLFPEEGHGFRQARHIAEALELEWRFYQHRLVRPAGPAT